MASQVAEVLSQVSSWPEHERLDLAKKILETVVPATPPSGTIADLVGLLDLGGPPPTDEECERLRDEELLRKYGA
jgi:hypothetical protein